MEQQNKRWPGHVQSKHELAVRWTFPDGHHEGEVVDGHLLAPPASRPVVGHLHEVVAKVEVVPGRDHQERLLQSIGVGVPRPCVLDRLGNQLEFASACTATRGKMK